MIQSLQNPFRDWNVSIDWTNSSKERFKASKTLLGIETCLRNVHESKKSGFKASKTLLGIET